MHLQKDSLPKFKSLCAGNALVAYGCGITGLNLLKELKVFDDIKYIVDDDSNKINKSFMGKSVFGKEKLREENTETIVVIVTTIYYPGVKKTVSEIGIKGCYSVFDFFDSEKESGDLSESIRFIERNIEKINRTEKLLADKKSRDIFAKIIALRQKASTEGYAQIAEADQYFPDLVTGKLTKEEIFLDLGVFDGFTTQTFINKVGNKFKKIIGFEADRVNFNKLKDVREQQIIHEIIDKRR